MSLNRLIPAILLFTLPAVAYAGDDAAVPAEKGKAIQAAMKSHIEQAQVGGSYYIYDPVADKMLDLKFKELHAGVMRAGAFYASCADFTAGDTAYDIDFLVAEKDGALKVVDAVIHQAGGKKRDYLMSK
jgi:hypothetical protein